ncbi:hypothetical protein HW132_26805 [Brasilonema sp. CT11]|nr:hypothetical protein [Brasilonema sp. CT11]
MLLQKEKLQHINSIAHEGKVVVIATDADGKIWYTVKQDGFEDSYLNTPEAQRTGWENWQELQLPDESDDQSVIDKETKELTYQNEISKFILKSRYKTQAESAVAPVQVVSGLGHLYIFRQSKSNTLLVDRFILDGLTNKLTRKLEVRFKRSKQKHKPSENMKKGTSGLANIDSLDFRDINGNDFYEPSTELCLVNNLQNGWFSVVLVPTNEQDKYRWHIFAYNSQTQKVELTTIRASDDALFDVKDYTVLEPKPDNEEILIPRSIPGIIKRTLDLGNVNVSNGLAATKYDIQRERQTEDGMQLLRESTRVMLTIPTTEGVAAISFAVAGDGTLSQIDQTPDTHIVRSNSRQILLPLNTLDEIKAIGTTTPPPQGNITEVKRGDSDKILITSDKASQLKNGAVVKIAQTRNYDGHYHARKIDHNTFEIDATWITNEIGTWEEVPPKETGLVFDGMITAVKRMANGKLHVTASNHGLDNGDEVQIVNTTAYNSSYPVTKINDQSFIIDGILWKAGEAVNLKLESRKRRGIVFDGNDDYITIPGSVLKAPSASENFEATCSAWIYHSTVGSTEQLIVDQKSASMELLINKSGKVAFQVGSGGSFDEVEDSDPLLPNQWVHYAGVCKKNPQSTTLMLYKNGVETVKEDFQQNNITVLSVLEETQKLQADDKLSYDFFGSSVAISEDTAIVGAYGKSKDSGGRNAGSAYIFQCNSVGELKQVKIQSNLGNFNDEFHFGNSVAISGNIAIVGAYREKIEGKSDVGSVYIFQHNGTGWALYQKLQAKDKQAGDRFGNSVAISENTVIVGAYYQGTGGSKAGSAYIFQRQAGRWQEVEKLQADDKEKIDLFGSSVAISGDTAIVGAPWEDTDGSKAGSAYIFQRNSTGWRQFQKLQANDKEPDDEFGNSVAISGGTAIVGAFHKGTDGSKAGSAYIFQRVEDTWQQVKKLQASDNKPNDKFGSSVAISGDTAIVGAFHKGTDGSKAGSAYIFQRVADTWEEVKKLQASDNEPNDEFGSSVAISGNTAIVGANGKDTGGSNAGSAYIFTLQKNSAIEQSLIEQSLIEQSLIGQSFVGKIADVQIWNKARTAQEITGLTQLAQCERYL